MCETPMYCLNNTNNNPLTKNELSGKNEMRV